MPQTELPLDIKLMTLTTHALALLFVVLSLGALGAWVLRHSVWSIQAISVHGEVAHQNAVSLRAQFALQMNSSLGGGLLALDLQQVRRLFESQPWVRQAVVQREFPNRLRVTLQEHEAVAWWGQSGSGQLVSRLGEVFDASPQDSDALPELAGPPGHADKVWTLYQQLSVELGRLDLLLHRLELNERGSWRATLDSGARIELGRGSAEELLARVRRFTATISQITQRHAGALESVDLRYPNGYALRIRGVTTVHSERPVSIQHIR